jgi:hypothetical protein
MRYYQTQKRESSMTSMEKRAYKKAAVADQT